VRRTVSIIAATVGFIASVIGIAIAPAEVWEWVYPLPVVIALAAALAATWAYLILARAKPSPHEQARLDRLLGALPRKAIRRLEEQDFIAPWPARSIYPVMYFVNELDGAEQQFNDKHLERTRAELYQAGCEFLEAEALNGYPHQQNRKLRNTGRLLGDLEGDDEALALAESRAAAISAPAARLLRAHRELLTFARRRGYDLEAAAGDPPVPPWEQEEDAESARSPQTNPQAGLLQQAEP
jgi:hypothetical protein